MKVYVSPRPFTLDCGTSIPLKVAYHTWGEPDPDGRNVIWIFHALTGSSDAAGWWPEMIGPGKPFDPDHHYIVCANVLGSPYGSARPEDLSFPELTVRDNARAFAQLAEQLGVQRIQTAVGASFGGAQALEFNFAFPGEIDEMILISCAARETPWGMANHEAQRMALLADQTFGRKGGGKDGLAAARSVALLNYRSLSLFNQTQSGPPVIENVPRPVSYMNHNGSKFVERFDPLCYYYLSQCLDTHDLGRDRGGIQDALRGITSRTLVVGVDDDLIIPFSEQARLSRWIPNARLLRKKSHCGHDYFLMRAEELACDIRNFQAVAHRA